VVRRSIVGLLILVVGVTPAAADVDPRHAGGLDVLRDELPGVADNGDFSTTIDRNVLPPYLTHPGVPARESVFGNGLLDGSPSSAPIPLTHHHHRRRSRHRRSKS
jgi:hypothetical protein